MYDILYTIQYTLYSTLLYSTLLYSTILYYTILYYTILNLLYYSSGSPPAVVQGRARPHQQRHLLRVGVPRDSLILVRLVSNS